jgi:hypothetical protein
LRTACGAGLVVAESLLGILLLGVFAGTAINPNRSPA